MKNWDRDKLLMELSKFSFKPLTAKRKVSLGPELESYLKFYNMDFTESLASVKQSIGWIDSTNYRVVLHSYMPANAKGTVFLFHGYFDHVGLYRHLIRFLLEHQFAVVAYDMPGHGLSSGQPTSISSFQDYQHVMQDCLDLCKDNMPEPFHCVGQSTGGAVLVEYLSKAESPMFEKVALLAPLVRPKDWKLVKGIHSTVKSFLSVWYRSFANNSNDAAFVDFVKNQDPLQSKWMAIDWITALRNWVPVIEASKTLKKKVLIVQGTDDQTVDWKHNINVLKKLFAEVKITYVENGRHHLVNESSNKRKQIFDAVLSELTGC